VSFGADVSSSLALDSGSWTDSYTYVATYNVTDVNIELANIKVDVSNAYYANGNLQQDYTAVPEFSIDTKNPTVTVNIVDTALSDSDNNSQVTFTFSEVPTGFELGDISTVGGTVSELIQNLGVDPTGRTYTATFTATDGFEGQGAVMIDANKFTDAALNPNETATLDTVNIDTTSPTVTVNQSFSYAENRGAGSVVATIAASDSNGINGFRFGNGTNLSDDGFFTIAPNGQITLTATGLAGAANNFESLPNNFTLGIEARDAAGNWSTAENIVITVTDVNESPIDITLSANNLNENSSIGTVITTLSAIDPDGTGSGFAGPFKYELAAGGADNSLVTIVGNELRVNGSIDFETKPSLEINVKATDAGGMSFTKTLTLTVNDVNDAPIAVADTNSGMEDSVIIGTVAGNDSDADAGSSLTYALASPVAGLTLNADGSYSFDAANAAYQHLADGATLDVVASYIVTDEHLATDSATLTSTLTGSNDAAVISGTVIGTVDEDNAITTTSGTLSASDIDNADNLFQTVAAPTVSLGGYGTYTITADGIWTYTLDNSHAAVTALNDTDELTDTFTVLSADGTSQTVTVTITGSNDAAVISGDVSGAINESDVAQSVNGVLSASDVDSATDFIAQSDVAGNNGFGQFTLDANGAWTYTMDSAHDEFVAGVDYTDSLTVATADGTTQVITVTITGSNDAAVISGTTTGTHFS
jgi:VCBS repeat-containing protein